MKTQIRTAVLCSLCLLILILDTKTVVLGGLRAIELCIYTVIPSLFPFFIITGILNSSLGGLKIPGLHNLGKFCKIPRGSESILLLGFLGGYPVGAKCINDCFMQGSLDKISARRMLAFCSNCGPSFLFGICASLFTHPRVIWYVWLIQILSAILTGISLPGNTDIAAEIPVGNQLSVHRSLKNSVLIMGEICGWIIAFRVVIELCQKWFLWFFPHTFQVLFIGLLELTNGCSMLYMISSEPMRFIICSCFLSFGGICVLMQSKSATNACGLGMYFPGKVIQLIFSFLLSSIFAILTYREIPPLIMVISVCIIIFFFPVLRYYRKRYGNNQVCVV